MSLSVQEKMYDFEIFELGKAMELVKLILCNSLSLLKSIESLYTTIFPCKIASLATSHVPNEEDVVDMRTESDEQEDTVPECCRQLEYVDSSDDEEQSSDDEDVNNQNPGQSLRRSSRVR